jgi:hypothetical protein
MFLQLTHKRKSARINARTESSAGRARPLQGSPSAAHLGEYEVRILLVAALGLLEET